MPAAWSGENMETLLRQSSQNGKYLQAHQSELSRTEFLFNRTFQNIDDHNLEKDWQSIGFEMQRISDSGEDYVVLREHENRREGRGFYIIRTGKSDPTLLQAPHSFKDEHTREIVYQLMLNSHFKAAVWNTVPRRYLDNGVQIDADMAHLKQTYFVSFSRAFVKSHNESRVIQIHGFANEKRNSAAGWGADMVLSSGVAQPSSSLLKMAKCLKNKFVQNVLIYPTEVRELGGTTNSIGDALRQMGHSEFMHIEMSAKMRQLALSDSTFPTRFLGCLQK